MCGRYTIEPVKDGWPALSALLTPAELTALRTLEPRHDIRPTQSVPVVRWAKDEALPRLASMRWGFIPSWWKQDKPPTSTFNARGEEAKSKSMWRQAVRASRCLIPATGWYEWMPIVDQGTGEIIMKPGSRLPVKHRMEMRLPEPATFCFAGLWSVAMVGGSSIETCTIVTRAALPPMDKVHDRMPAVAPPDAYREWLNPQNTDPKTFEAATAWPMPGQVTILDSDAPG